MDEFDNVVVAKFDEPSKAYQALSKIRNAEAAGRLMVNQAGVVERAKDGTFRVPEGADNLSGLGLGTGSLLGMAIGVLGGPVGLLLGWGTGAAIGGIFDVGRESSSETALAVLARSLPPGSTALVADVREFATEVLDGEIQKLGGTLTRRRTSEVLAEVEAIEEAAMAAAEGAERVMRARRKQERLEKREEREAKLKEKFHKADEALRSL